MCQQLKLKIKSYSPFAPKMAYLPCGECFNCRTIVRDSWTTRLRLAVDELLANDHNAWCGFLTLTYRESKIPRIPRSLLKKTAKDSYNEMPYCFSKQHVSSYIKDLRDWLSDKFGVKNPIYMICSEYGSNETERSHYHMFIALPSCCPAIQVFFRLKNKWKKYGFTYPKDFLGGRDKHGYTHKPFVVDSITKGISYAAKYCCKDITFFKSIKLEDFNKATPRGLRLSDYLPFHKQTRSLGLNGLSSLSDAQKLSILRDGFQFAGDDFFHSAPVYIRRKILFKPSYEYINSKRVVKQYASEFLKRHYKEVYAERLAGFEAIYKDWSSSSFWSVNPDLDIEEKHEMFELCKRVSRFTLRELAHMRLVWFGVPFKNCMLFSESSAPSFWLNRYLKAPFDGAYLGESNVTDYCDFHLFTARCIELSNRSNSAEALRKEVEELERKRVADFHKSRRY